MHAVKKYPVIGACGLDCGLCPRYYTRGKSRCPGCAGADFSIRHPSCSFITCCVAKRNYETCGTCPDFPCPKFKTEEAYTHLRESSSYPPCGNIYKNQRFIREYGIEAFIKTQKRRIDFLEVMLQDFDDGRSKSYFCRVAALADVFVLEKALSNAALKTNTEQRILAGDKAKVLKTILHELNL